MIRTALVRGRLLRRFVKGHLSMPPAGRRRRNFALWTLCCVLAGCSAAPSQNILGSYFPSWMICALIGLVVTVVVRQIFGLAGIDRTLPVPLVVYLAIATAAAFATWLIWLDPS